MRYVTVVYDSGGRSGGSGGGGLDCTAVLINEGY